MKTKTRRICSLLTALVFCAALLTALPLSVSAAWGDAGVLDLSALPAGDESNSAPQYPWTWEAASKILTLTGPGPYTLTGSGEACVVINASQDTIVALNGSLTAPPVASWFGHSAITVSGAGGLSVTGSGSITGGSAAGMGFGGYAIILPNAASSLTVSGDIQLNGGDAMAAGFAIRFEFGASFLRFDGNVKVTGGTSGVSGTSPSGIYTNTGNTDLTLSGTAEITGGNDGTVGGGFPLVNCTVFLTTRPPPFC